MNSARFTGSRRNAASIFLRACHNARIVGTAKPLSSGWSCSSRKASRMAEGCFWNRAWAASRSSLCTRKRSLSGLGSAFTAGKMRPPQVLQHDGVEQLNLLRGAVEALHQLLAGAPGRRIGKPVFLGQCGLKIEQQAVFPPRSQVMQPHPQFGKRGLVALQLPRFLAREDALFGEIAPTATEAVPRARSTGCSADRAGRRDSP